LWWRKDRRLSLRRRAANGLPACTSPTRELDLRKLLPPKIAREKEGKASRSPLHLDGGRATSEQLPPVVLLRPPLKSPLNYANEQFNHPIGAFQGNSVYARRHGEDRGRPLSTGSAKPPAKLDNGQNACV